MIDEIVFVLLVVVGVALALPKINELINKVNNNDRKQ